MEINVKWRQLIIEGEQTHFRFLTNDHLEKELSLGTGYQHLVQTFFKSALPTEAETEYAINFIEDELMSNKELLNNEEQLICEQNHYTNLFRKNGLEQSVLTRREVEDLFANYAYVIMGGRAMEKSVEIRSHDFALLLLLREIMHHLNFETITLTS